MEEFILHRAPRVAPVWCLADEPSVTERILIAISPSSRYDETWVVPFLPLESLNPFVQSFQQPCEYQIDSPTQSMPQEGSQ